MEITKYLDRIEVNPNVMFGKPVIRDTRITVELILEELAASKPVDDLIQSFPKITKEDVFACLCFYFFFRMIGEGG